MAEDTAPKVAREDLDETEHDEKLVQQAHVALGMLITWCDRGTAEHLVSSSESA